MYGINNVLCRTIYERVQTSPGMIGDCELIHCNRSPATVSLRIQALNIAFLHVAGRWDVHKEGVPTVTLVANLLQKLQFPFHIFIASSLATLSSCYC